MSRMIRFVMVVTLWLGLGPAGAWSASPWHQIVANQPFEDSDGMWRTPSCSGGPLPSPNGLVPAETEFSFFARLGDPDKLLIILDGGGACWEPNTCIGSALAGDPTYDLTVDENPEELAEVGGIADIDNPDNPFRDYTQVFVPYCTGDIHWGSQDTEYQFTQPDGSVLSWTIHHRGFDNFLAVLELIKAYYQRHIGYAPGELVVVGASAGGYGTLLALPAVQAVLPPWTRAYLIADSANGVITDDFYDQALGGYTLTGGSWGVAQNVPDFLFTAFASGADSLAHSVYTTLAWRYPLTRFGQYTSAWDVGQVYYYNVMKNIDSPESWTDPGQLLAAASEWSGKARDYMQLSAASPNYRFYIAAGNRHTVLADDSFYAEDSAEGVYLTDWMDDMLDDPLQGDSSSSDWRNVSCSPNCLRTLTWFP